MPDPVNIEIVTSASIDDLKALYKSAGWWETSHDQDSDFLNHIVKRSALFAGAFFKNKMIGMGRVISDLVSDAYIQDVVVLDEYKGQGIGKNIIKLLVEKLKENNVDWIGLVAEPGTSSFYEDLGFVQLKDHVPLKYKD